VEPDDLWRAFERAEHEDDPPILAGMGDGFDAAAREVQVRDLARPEDAERIHSFRGAIDQAIVSERSRRDEEHVLSLNPA
jgi:hypothetical protein